MVKKEAETAKIQDIKSKKMLKVLLVLLIVSGGGLALYKNPQYIEEIKSWFKQEPKVDVYQPQLDDHNQQISELNEQIRNLRQQIGAVSVRIKEPDFAPIYDRINMVEKINSQVLDAKANVSTVLGLINRMDNAEQKLDKLEIINDDSALILTATMLVKDAAATGKPFEYEAGVLSQVVRDNVKLQTYVSKIETFASKGVPTEFQLMKEFGEIYEQNLDASETDVVENKNWKDRLLAKLNELVQVKKTNIVVPQSAKNKIWSETYELVMNAKFEDAANNLRGAGLADNADVASWIAKVNLHIEFEQLINKLAAQSLAIMKVKFLKR